MIMASPRTQVSAALARTAWLWSSFHGRRHPGRMAENIDIFDFELTEEEMSKISSLDRGESVVTDSDQFGH